MTYQSSHDLKCHLLHKLSKPMNIHVGQSDTFFVTESKFYVWNCVEKQPFHFNYFDGFSIKKMDQTHEVNSILTTTGEVFYWPNKPIEVCTKPQQMHGTQWIDINYGMCLSQDFKIFDIYTGMEQVWIPHDVKFIQLISARPNHKVVGRDINGDYIAYFTEDNTVHKFPLKAPGNQEKWITLFELNYRIIGFTESKRVYLSSIIGCAILMEEEESMLWTEIDSLPHIPWNDLNEYQVGRSIASIIMHDDVYHIYCGLEGDLIGVPRTKAQDIHNFKSCFISKWSMIGLSRDGNICTVDLLDLNLNVNDTGLQPIPIGEWTPQKHHLYGKEIRDRTKTLMLLSLNTPNTSKPFRPETNINLLPKDVLYQIIKLVNSRPVIKHQIGPLSYLDIEITHAQKKRKTNAIHGL